MLHVVILLACAVAIYLSCEWFVNAVEWLGLRLKIGPLAVGTVLAAFGTALPESVVTFVAVVFGSGSAQKDIGVGAAMGGPLALATAAYGVTGFMLLTRRRKVTSGAPDRAPGEHAGGGDVGDTRKLARDQQWFLAIFVVKVALGLVAFAYKPVLGLLFFAAYGVYFWRELRADPVEARTTRSTSSRCACSRAARPRPPGRSSPRPSSPWSSSSWPRSCSCTRWRRSAR